MKKHIINSIIFQLFLTHFYTFTYGQNEFSFTDAKWVNIRQLVQKEGRMAVVIVEAKNCNTCQNFRKFILPQAQVVAFYKDFLNIAMDISEIPDSVQTGINMEDLPLLIYFDSKGSLVHTALATMESDDFIEQGEQAKEAALKLPAFYTQYLEGNYSPSFLYEYAFLLKNSNQNTDEVVEDYLGTQTDEQLLEEPNQFFILSFVNHTHIHAFQLLLNNLPIFYRDMGEEMVNNHLTEVIGGMYAEALMNKDNHQFQACTQLIYKIFPDKAHFMNQQMAFNFYANIENYPKYAQMVLQAQTSEEPLTDEELAQHLSTLVLHVKDHVLLERLEKLAQQLSFRNPNYSNQLLLANFYFRLGKKKEAKVLCESAIRVAQGSKKNYSDATELMEKIKDL